MLATLLDSLRRYRRTTPRFSVVEPSLFGTVERKPIATIPLHDRTLLRFKDMEWTLGDAMEGLFIIGATGSGKSSTSGKTVAKTFLQEGMGGLVLTAKSSDVAFWEKLAAATGRADDLIIFSPDSGHYFDPIAYEWQAARNIESIVEVFDTLLSLEQKKEGSAESRFWTNATHELVRICTRMLDIANEPLSIANFYKLITSFPTFPKENETAEWQDTSHAAGVINLIRERQDELGIDEWEDLDIATRYALEKWPAMSDRTRPDILATFSGLASKMLFNPMARIFNSGKCTITPEMTREGKIIVVDWPILRWNETGRLVNCLLKLIFQRAWLREPGPPCYLYADECQLFILPKGRDNAFQQVCRSFNVATVYLTQNIAQIAEAMGEDQIGPKTKGWLANLVTKICHAQSCFDTNTYMANCIGREYRYLNSVNVAQGQSSLGRNEHLAYKLEPAFFTTLAKPDTRNPIAEAVVYQGGKILDQDRCFALVRFSR